MLLPQELWLDLFWLLYFNIQIAVLLIFWNKPLHPFALLLPEILSKCTFFLGFHISTQIFDHDQTPAAQTQPRSEMSLSLHHRPLPTWQSWWLPWGHPTAQFVWALLIAALPSPPGWAEPSPAAFQPSFLCWSTWEMLTGTLQLWAWGPLHRQPKNGNILICRSHFCSDQFIITFSR